MKSCWALLALLSLVPVTFAQPALTRADVFDVGEVVNYLALDATGAEPGPDGNGVTWDFSDLPRNPADDYTSKYDAPSAAPNAGLFPSANLVAIQDTGETTGYTFFEVSDSRFTLLGLDLPDLGVVDYNDTSIWLDFPLGFNETQSDDFAATYVLDIGGGITAMGNRTGSLTTTYDAFGTITLPDGTTIQDVRRLKLDQIIEDVVNVSGTSITTRVETITYSWFAAGEQDFVFQLTLADTTVSPPGLTTSSRNAVYRGVDGGGGGPIATATRRGAHLTAQGGQFDSQILVRNTSDSAQQVTLTAYDGSGAELSSVPIDLAPGGTSRALAQTYFVETAASFSVDGCDACITSVGYRAAQPGASTAQVHETGDYQNRFVFYPGEWDALFDGAAVVNAGTAAAAVTARQLDAGGNVIAEATLAESLAPGAKQLSIFNSLFDADPNSLVEIVSDQPMAVMILRISLDFQYMYQNLPIPDQPAAGEPRWLAHITSETGGFDTDIYITNRSDTTQGIVLQPFANDGQPFAPVALEVGGNSTQRYAKTDILPAEVSHALITGAGEVLVTAGYRARVDGASTAPIHETTPVDSFEVYPGEWDLLFDGFALVNTGSVPTTITAIQISDDGTELNRAELVEDLAPNGKYLGVLEGVFPEVADSVIRVESNTSLAVLALRLSKDNRFLYNNNLIPTR